MASDPWSAGFDLVGSAFDFAGGLIYSEEERARDELIGDQIDLDRHKVDATVDLAETQARSRLISDVQLSGRTRTLALAGVAGVVVLVGGAALIWGEA